MTKGYLPCRMATTLRSALELGDGRVLLDRVGLVLHPSHELVGRAALVEQLVGGGAQLGVELLVPAVEAVAEGRLGSLQRGAGAGQARRERQALGGALDRG